MQLPLPPYIHLLPPYTPKSLFSSLTTLTPLLRHFSANAPFQFLSSLLFLITLLSSCPLSSLVPFLLFLWHFPHCTLLISLTPYLPSALLLNREIHVQLSSAGSYQMAPGRIQTSALPNSAQTGLRRIRSCINSLCVKMQAMQPSTGVLTRSL